MRPKIAKQLHDIWGEERTLHAGNTTFLGVKAERNPLDAWVFQEIIYEHKPDLIIETGTHRGGTTLFLATILDAMNSGHIVSVERFDMPRPAHPRITYLTGNSADLPIYEQIRDIAKNFKAVMVILDSDHHKDHVFKEMEYYGSLVSSGQYLIVDDSYFDPDGDGPYQAVKKYLSKHPEFKIDFSREKYKLTFCPRGFLLRK